MTANKAKLILNPATLRPAMRVDRPKGASVPVAGQACQVQDCAQPASERLTIGKDALSLWCCRDHAAVYRPQQTTQEQYHQSAQYPRLGCDAPHAGVYVSAETRAYWRGFADGAREAQAAFDKQELASLSAMAASYTTKTRGF